jgi:hypothetical protein
VQSCPWMVVDSDLLKQAYFVQPEGWQNVQAVRRRSSTDAETLLIYKRLSP